MNTGKSLSLVGLLLGLLLLGGCGPSNGSNDADGGGGGDKDAGMMDTEEDTGGNDGGDNMDGGGDDVSDTDDGGDDGGGSKGGTLGLTVEDLPSLGSDHTYAGWVFVDGSAKFAGRYDGKDDEKEDVSLDIKTEFVDNASAVGVSIEPTGSKPDGPTSPILAGSVEDGEAELTIESDKALGTNLAGDMSSGDYVVFTPTSETEDDYTNGVWFFKLEDFDEPIDDDNKRSAGLNIPELPEGWQYESWVVEGDEHTSLGTFRDPAKADSDGPGDAAGPKTDNAPDFPGQDFVDPAKNLTEGEKKLKVTVEPKPDFSDEPFDTLEFLRDSNINDPSVKPSQGGKKTQQIGGVAAFLPEGSATLEKK